LKWSVCIPTTGENSTYSAIESVLSQNVDFDFEVIVAGHIPDSIPSHKNIHTIHTGKIPPGKARNTAVSRAKGKYLAFIDADCQALSGWLDSLDKRMEKGADLIGGAVLFPKSDYFTLADNVSSFFDQTPYRDSGFTETIAALNMACKKDIFDNIGPFNPIILAGEDLEWVLRAKRTGIIPYLEPVAQCLHHGGRNSFSTMIDHSMAWGRESIWVRKAFSKEINTPILFFRPNILSVLSPFIGAAFATKIIFSPGMIKYWKTWPAIVMAKTAWCLAASESLRKNR